MGKMKGRVRCSGEGEEMARRWSVELSHKEGRSGDGCWRL